MRAPTLSSLLFCCRRFAIPCHASCTPPGAGKGITDTTSARGIGRSDIWLVSQRLGLSDVRKRSNPMPCVAPWGLGWLLVVKHWVSRG